jgi:hypothetical protein
MIRLITFAIGAVLAILISYYFIKYAIKFFKWLFDKCKLIKPIKINWKYYSRKKVRLRKELHKVFMKGLEIGKKKILRQDNGVTIYQIELPNLSTISIKSASEKSNFIILKSGYENDEISTIEYISKSKAKNYIYYFKGEDNDVDELKRTVDDIIRESERINYTEKLEEIENFQQKMK